MTVNRAVVVGVDGSPSSTCAVRWTAETASRHHSPLLLLSSWAVSVAAYGGVGLPQSFFDDQEAEGKRRLVEATKVADDAAPGVESSFSTVLVAGRAIEQLIDRSKNARMVVLGSRGRGEFTGGLLGSVTSALAHHAHCPVAVIHERPCQTTPTVLGPVVLGVDGTANSDSAIAVAFDEASVRGVDLVAVHAWSDVTLATFSPHDEGLPWASIDTGEQASLAESLAGWKEQYPDVGVSTVVVQDRPVRNLLSYTDTAALLSWVAVAAAVSRACCSDPPALRCCTQPSAP